MNALCILRLRPENDYCPEKTTGVQCVRVIVNSATSEAKGRLTPDASLDKQERTSIFIAIKPTP